MREAEPMLAIGLMSGTSMDGIDVALIETDGDRHVRRIAADGFAYDAGFRRRLGEALEAAKTIVHRDERPGELSALEREISDRNTEAVRRFLSAEGIGPAEIGVVGFHGQTVLHRPEKALTVQIGDGRRVCDSLGIDVVYDVRAADMRAGGQGAPLVPAYHAALAAGLPEALQVLPVVFVNIGGISNITYVDGKSAPIAFDTGPGNALIDQWVAREAGLPFDENGAVAAEGELIEDLAARYLSAAFFAKPAPKSLDRFDFAVPSPKAGPLADVARTLCFVTAEAILKAADHLPEAPKLWIVGGGGRKHPTIMADLADGAAKRGAKIVVAEDAGLNGDAVEAEAWAYLAVRSVRGMPLTWPTTTGCRTPTVGGVLARATSGASA